MNNRNIAAIVLILFIVALIVAGSVTSTGSTNGDHCHGMDYDYGQCLVERVDSCMATDKFTRDECIRLVGNP